jgi:anti-sigma regulatory factor (Ser/Thr protein kinase)
MPERDEVAKLHAALLPAGLPVLPRVRIAARQLPGLADQAIGGDWFDAAVLPGGLVALMVGEVPGGGLAASAAAGQLRAVLSELLATVPDLAAALARADGFAARTPALTAATLAVAVLDPASGTLRHAACGHPAPLVIAPGAQARFLTAGKSGPLGTGSAPDVAAATLEPGELVALYSDGLTARPGRTPAEAIGDLAHVAAHAAANRTLPASAPAGAADRLCQLTAELLASGGYADDVTVLAAQRLPRPVPELDLELPARVDSLSEARRLFGDWLAEVAPLADGVDALQLALSELVVNAIEHAYPPGGAGSVRIYAGIGQDGLLECRVTDHGRWREPDHDEDRGNGLMLASYMAAEFAVSHPPQPAGQPRGSRGTVVTLRCRLLRPALLGPAAGVRSGADTWPPLRAEIPALGQAVVRGQAGVGSAEQLAGRLLSACLGGAMPLTVDLTGVTSLSSTAIRILFLVRDRLAAHRQDLVLVAERGSQVGAVLDLACLPYQDKRCRLAPGQGSGEAQ